MKFFAHFSGRAVACGVVTFAFAAPFGWSSAAQRPTEPSASKRQALERSDVRPYVVEAPLRADAAEMLLKINSRGAVRHVGVTASGRVGSLYGDLGSIAPASQKAVAGGDAIAFVAGLGPLVGVVDAPRELTLERRTQNTFGERVTLSQTLGDYRVFDSYTTIDIGRDGRVFGLTSSFATDLDPTLGEATPLFDAAAAKTAALVKLGIAADHLRPGEDASAELGIAPEDGGHLAWRVSVPTREPYGQWELTVDALSGRIVGQPRDVAMYIGKAKVFIPNPVVSTGNATLKDQNNSVSAVPESGYIAADLNGLDSSGFLTGTFVTTDRTTTRVQIPGNDYSALRRADRGFDEVEAYWAIDLAQRYIQNTLGIHNAANYQIRVAVHAFSDDNSNYTSNGGTGVLNFGDGGVDDSQDAEIVWHEYGHAILDNQAQIRLGMGESGAIHEGWGDYVAATMSTTVPGDSKFYPTIGEWDATSYSNANPPFLRRVDGTKRYPSDLDGEVHDDGEIWSACLWGIHKALGRSVADPILFNANFLFPFSVTMPDAAAAVLEADVQLNGGANSSAIRNVFGQHGIDVGFATPSISGVKVKKNKIVVDGADFVTNSAIIEVDGVAYGSLKYPTKFRRKGVSRRVTSKDARVGALAPGVAVQVTVLNPTTGARSAAFAYTP